MCLWVGGRLEWVWWVSRGWMGCVGGWVWAGRRGVGENGCGTGGRVGWGSRVGRGNLWIGGCVAGTGRGGVGESRWEGWMCA